MRETLDILPELEAARKEVARLEREHLRSPVSKKYAVFKLNGVRSANSIWYGPYWQDAHNRTCNAGRLVREYSWSIVMVYSVDEDRVVHVVSDLKKPIPPADELLKTCKDLIDKPNLQ